MVAINFNFLGYDYEHGIMVLSDSLLAAVDALGARRRQTQADWDEYERATGAGERERECEIDDETGATIWNRSHFFQHDLRLIGEGVQALRKAYVIALYHHWERLIRQWTGAADNARHDRLARNLALKSIQPPARFNDVYRLNNVLKHNSRNAGPALLVSWPALFPQAARLQARVANGDQSFAWEATITLDQGHMEEIFATMRASGPTADLVGT